MVGTEVFNGQFADMEKFVPQKLSRRQVVSKFSAIHDPLGKFVPITGAMKVHVRRAVMETSDWDAHVSAETRSIWVKNFWRLEKLKGLQFSRARIPIDAVDTKLQLVACVDAANELSRYIADSIKEPKHPNASINVLNFEKAKHEIISIVSHIVDQFLSKKSTNI